MYTSMMLVALMGPGAAQVKTPEPLSWQENYTAARKMGQEQNKPLAVVVGSGAKGWEKLSKDKLTPKVQKLFSQGYVCVYIDADTPKGKRLAKAFSLSQGLVISTRDGEDQAFRHSGQIGRSDLETSLKRYSTDFVSATTETLDDQGVEEQQAKGGRRGGSGGAPWAAPAAAMPASVAAATALVAAVLVAAAVTAWAVAAVVVAAVPAWAVVAVAAVAAGVMVAVVAVAGKSRFPFLGWISRPEGQCRRGRDEQDCSFLPFSFLSPLARLELSEAALTP